MNARAPDTAISGLAPPAPAVYLHCAIFVENGILGPETFRAVSLRGEERVSEPFQLELELHANTDPDRSAPLALDDLIGRHVTVGIDLPLARPHDEGWYEERFRAALAARDARALQPYADELTLWNGIVASFSMEAPGVYKLAVRPRLWMLTLTNRYRLRRNMSVKQAIADVLLDHDVEHRMDGLAGGDDVAVTRVQDWLQAGESDYDFVRRLMAKAHIYYTFEHYGGAHRVVFANRPEYPKLFDDGRPLRYVGTDADALGLERADALTEYAYRRSLVASGVRSVFARQDAAWENKTVAGFHALPAPDEEDQGALPVHLYKVYQYPLSKKEVDSYTAKAASALDASRAQLAGATTCPRLRVGRAFQVAGRLPKSAPDDPDVLPLRVRPALEGKRFVLTQVQHEATLDGAYRNRFEATDAGTLIAPFSVQDTQQGALLARVVANGAGNKAPETWSYYARDNFQPADSGYSNEAYDPRELKAKGVYVRFCTELPDGDAAPPVWVKLAAHMTSVPEIGTTVTVARASDESELPEIQSILQANGAYTVVPPDRWSANTHVGNSWSTSYGDSRSVRFGDKSVADQAKLNAAYKIVNAAYDRGIFKDASYSQGASYGYSTSESGDDGVLSDNESHGSTYSRHSGKESRNESTLGSTYSKSLVNGSAESVNEVRGRSTSTTTMSDVHNTTKIGSQTSSSAIGATNSNDTVGVSNSNSLMGVVNSNRVTVASVDMSAVGTSASVSAVGASASVSYRQTGVEASISGPVASVSSVNGGVHIRIGAGHIETDLTSCQITVLQAFKIMT